MNCYSELAGSPHDDNTRASIMSCSVPCVQSNVRVSLEGHLGFQVTLLGFFVCHNTLLSCRTFKIPEKKSNQNQISHRHTVNLQTTNTC